MCPRAPKRSRLSKLNTVDREALQEADRPRRLARECYVLIPCIERLEVENRLLREEIERKQQILDNLKRQVQSLYKRKLRQPPAYESP